MISDQQIFSLVRRAITNRASVEDYDQLIESVNNDEDGRIEQAVTDFLRSKSIAEEGVLYDFKYWDALGKRIIKSDPPISILRNLAQKSRMLEAKWLRYAAAIILIIGALDHLSTLHQSKPDLVENVISVQDISAGKAPGITGLLSMFK